MKPGCVLVGKFIRINEAGGGRYRHLTDGEECRGEASGEQFGGNVNLGQDLAGNIMSR